MWQFLNPLFLWAGTATAIPLLLHLMQRRRVVPMQFSTIRFIKLAQKRSSSRIRMENFILWLLRTLLLILLTLAFAMPILRTQAFGPLLGAAQRDIAIVWDATFSMGYESSRRNVWSDSRQTVLDLIDGLAPGDRLTLFLAADYVVPLIEQPSADFEQARALVNAQVLPPVEGQLAPALIAAAASLKESGRREREVYIVTDGQALAWRDFQIAAEERERRPATAAGDVSAAPPDEPASQTGEQWNPEMLSEQTQVFVALLGAENPENIAPIELEVQPSVLMAGMPARLEARIGRTGPARDLTVTLHLGGFESRQRPLTVPDDGVAALEFQLPPLPPGLHEGWIETPPDGLNIDNRLYFTLRVRDRMPVAVIGAPADVFFLERALNPVEERASVEVSSFLPANAPADGLSRFATVFLCNALPLSGEAVMALENYVQTGGLLVLFPGDRAQPRDYESWTLLPAWPERIDEIPAGRRRRILLLLTPGDPLFRGMQLPPGTIPTIQVQRETRPLRRHARTVDVVGAGAEHPFLLAREDGSGRVLMFTVSADRRWSDLPLSPFFLPFIHQIVRFGAGLGDDPLYRAASRIMTLSDFLPDIPPETDRLRGPDGADLTIRAVQREHRAIRVVEDALEPGFYALHAPGAVEPATAFAVNVSRDESDLTRVDTEAIPRWLGTKALHLARDREQLLRMLNEHRLGRPLTEIMLWLAFLVSLVELFTANRLCRSGKPLSREMVVEKSGRVRKA